MSFDLMVFQPEAAPPTRAEFMAWFQELTRWGEGHNYDDPAVTTPALQGWYREMIERFPAMNGPDAVPETSDLFDADEVTGYTCARMAIYLDFRWQVAEAAYLHVFALAQKHRLGFFDVSADDGEVWLPVGTEGYEVAYSA